MSDDRSVDSDAFSMKQAMHACQLMEGRCERGTAAYKAGTLTMAAVLSAANPPAGHVCPLFGVGGGNVTDHNQSEPLTYLHSSARPFISLQHFAEVIVGQCPSGIEPHVLNAALVVMLRFEESTGLPLTELIMHRLFLACLVVAGKVHDDSYTGIRELSRATGVPLRELVDLETDVCVALEWRVQVAGHEIELLAESMGALHPLIVKCSDYVEQATEATNDKSEDNQDGRYSPAVSMFEIVPTAASCGVDTAGWTAMAASAASVITPLDASLRDARVASSAP